jgi:hypothetical protein
MGNMTAPPIDYQAVLADLYARRAQLDAAITVIQAMLGTSTGTDDGAQANAMSPGSVLAPPAPPPARQDAPATTAVRSDTFFGLSTSGAIKKYLGMVKRPLSPRAIAQAVMEGGQIHAVDDKTAYTNVYSVLKRLKDKEFSQTRNGEWGLVEWYSNKARQEGE